VDATFGELMKEVAWGEWFVYKVFELRFFTFDKFNVVCSDFKD